MMKARMAPAGCRRTMGALCALMAVLSWTAPLKAQNGPTNTLTSPSANLQTALSAGGTVLLNFNGTLTVTRPVKVSTDVILDSAGFSPVVSGGGTTPIFVVQPGVTFQIRNLTISGGRNAATNGLNGVNGANSGNFNSGGNGGPGAIGTNAHGGALYNQGTTIAVNCLFLTNTVAGSSGGSGGNGGNSQLQPGSGGNGGNGGTASGGAIYNLNTLVCSNCTFDGNSAVGGNGGAGGTGGSGGGLPAYSGAGGIGGMAAGAAIYNGAAASNCSILSCTFAANFCTGGNSQAATGAPDNGGNGHPGPSGASAFGGAIYNASSAISDMVVNSTFFENISYGGGGGNGGNAATGVNAGVGGNGGSAAGGSFYNDSTGFVALTNCTFDGGQVWGGTNGTSGTGSFTNGSASFGSSIGANIANNGGTVLLKNSILAYPTNAFNASGTITDQGNNISSDGTPALYSGNNLDPLLGTLTTNGGPTQTILPATDGPAVGMITDGSAPVFDQRGIIRTLPADIGAVSVIPAFTISGQVTTNNGTNALANATVIVNGPANLYTSTDANGRYSFLLPAGTYTVTPFYPGLFFSPVDFVAVNLAQPINTNFNGYTPQFFDNAALLTASNQVYYLAFTNSTVFGYYSLQSSPWIYHFDMGYEFFFDAQDGKGDAYLYDLATTHYFYTGPSLWPYLYDFSLNTWLYYSPDSSNSGHYTTNPRWFYNINSNAWFTQ